MYIQILLHNVWRGSRGTQTLANDYKFGNLYRTNLSPHDGVHFSSIHLSVFKLILCSHRIFSCLHNLCFGGRSSSLKYARGVCCKLVWKLFLFHYQCWNICHLSVIRSGAISNAIWKLGYFTISKYNNFIAPKKLLQPILAWKHFWKQIAPLRSRVLKRHFRLIYLSMFMIITDKYPKKILERLHYVKYNTISVCFRFFKYRSTVHITFGVMFLIVPVVGPSVVNRRMVTKGSKSQIDDPPTSISIMLLKQCTADLVCQWFDLIWFFKINKHAFQKMY